MKVSPRGLRRRTMIQNAITRKAYVAKENEIERERGRDRQTDRDRDSVNYAIKSIEE